jgi:hypothetical protein
VTGVEQQQETPFTTLDVPCTMLSHHPKQAKAAVLCATQKGRPVMARSQSVSMSYNLLTEHQRQASGMCALEQIAMLGVATKLDSSMGLQAVVMQSTTMMFVVHGGAKHHQANGSSMGRAQQLVASATHCCLPGCLSEQH